jgi:prolyl-tRNA synthetase
MKLSRYFLPILKETPKEATINSHILMLKAGMIRQTSSGIYIWLPLGLKVLDKISNIVKAEMNKTGALNCLMPTIQSSDIWITSGRYEDYGLEMLRIKDRHNREMLYGPTNEEQITQVFKDNVKSYKDLPMNLYQIQWKFRDEIRPRFGVMRGREFLMKDAYSFDLSEEKATLSYKKMFASYLKIFNTMGLKAIPMKADTGPIGGDLSHEFMILADTGESEVYCDKSILDLDFTNKEIDYEKDVESIYNKYTSYYCATDEKHNDNDELYVKNKHNVVSQRGIEVGHIFYFADKYSKPFDLSLLDGDGKMTDVLMGSYGIGVSRLIGAIIESSFDDKGIIWHKNVSPFDLIINTLGNSLELEEIGQKLYSTMLTNGIDVLYNDKSDSAGVKLASADLIGIPYQLNIGNKSLQNNSCELKNRATGEILTIALNEIEKILDILRS